MVSPPHREPQPSQTSEVTAGEPVFGDYDEEDRPSTGSLTRSQATDTTARGTAPRSPVSALTPARNTRTTSTTAGASRTTSTSTLSSTSLLGRALATVASAQGHGGGGGREELHASMRVARLAIRCR